LVEVWLPYGGSEIPVRVAEERLVDILRPNTSESPLNTLQEIKRLLEGNRDLEKLAGSGGRICIALGACGSRQLLFDIVKCLVDHLIQKGASVEAVTVLCTQESGGLDLSSFSGIKVVTHNPASSEAIELGESTNKYRPSIDASLISADLKIVLGELKPHPWMQYSGLSDVVLPGLASLNSIKNHLANRKEMDSSGLFKERMSTASSIENLFGLGFVLDGNSAPTRLCLGAISDCVNELGAAVSEVSTRKIERAADIVVISAGGHPKDGSLLSAVEVFPTGLAALKKDGALIVAAECAAGHGDTEFYDWTAERKEPRYLEARLRHSFNYNGFKAAYLARSLENHRIHLVSTIPDHYVEHAFGMRPAETVNLALQTAQRALGSDSRVLVIPDAGRITPVLSPRS
jgi:nickel-dependent lactate racemase